MTSCGRILLPFVAKCFCTYAHTRRHTLVVAIHPGNQKCFQTSAFNKIHNRLARGLGTIITSRTGKRRSDTSKE